ncbi:helix-turn-helix domain-containing protein, partial [Candidatus Dojkabacteria bacterium]|nr:helix-turn-helix domain-containing protein [Candidatus Dojkabacteria bacterium]
EIDASFGSLSRIENDQTNPTKETLMKIAKVLNLREDEISYLLGVSDGPVSEETIENAVKFVSRFLNPDERLFYLVDDTWTLLYYSEGMRKLLDIDPQIAELVLGKNILELCLSPDFPLARLFSKHNYDEFISNQVDFFLEESGYRRMEPWFEKLVNKLNMYPEFKSAWKDRERKTVANSLERTFQISMGGADINVAYTKTRLEQFPRIGIIEWELKM